MYADSTSYEGIIDLTAISPQGAMISQDTFNEFCRQADTTGGFSCYLDERQRLHIIITDRSKLKIGRNILNFPVEYTEQGLDRVRNELVYRPVNLRITIDVKR
jgi:hypothetical protein